MAIQVDVGKIREKIAKVMTRHHVKRAAIFGSIAKNEAKKGSDVDILVDSPSIKFKNPEHISITCLVHQLQ